MNKLWLYTPVIVAIVCVGMFAQPTKNIAPRNVTVDDLIINQTGDSIGAVTHWKLPPPGGVRRFPLASFNLQAIEDGTGDVLGFSSVTATTVDDTVWIPMPPLGDSFFFIVNVVSVDNAGNESPPTSSTMQTWVTTPLMPLPPDSVVVHIDTSQNALVFDSLHVITHANALRAPNGNYWLPNIGDTLRFAAVLYSAGTPVQCCCQLMTDPPGTHPCDGITLGSIRSLWPGQTTVPYVRAGAFKVVGDTSQAVLARVNLPARGKTMLPEYKLWARQRYALQHGAKTRVGS